MRRRGSFDFPVAAVAARVAMDGDTVKAADLVLNAVGPAPVECTEAVELILGKTLDDDTIAEAAKIATRAAKPLDNTDQVSRWRKKVVEVEVRRALASFR